MAPPLDVPRPLFWIACVGLLPLLLLLSVWVLIERPTLFDTDVPRPLAFKVLEDPVNSYSARTVPALLAPVETRLKFSTERSESAFWIHVDLPEELSAFRWLTYPSRHATEIQCWSNNLETALGRADHVHHDGLIVPAMGGFALDMASLHPLQSVICRTRFVGPARVTVAAQADEGFIAAQRLWDGRLGFLQGGLLTLTLLSLALALTKKDARFMLLAVWLLLGLRMGQMSAGADQQWLSHTLGQDWLPLLRRLTIASYFMVTVMLHGIALSRVDASFRVPLGLRYAVIISSLMLIGLAFFLPYRNFLPVMWVTVGVGVVTTLTDLVFALLKDRQKIAVAYALAVMTVIIGAGWEIVAAAAGLQTGPLNHMTATMIAAFLIVLAQAEHLLAETRDKLAAQDRLAEVYTHVPIGLFTLTENGDILNRNPAFETLLSGKSRLETPGTWTSRFRSEDLNRLLLMLRARAAADLEVESNDGRIFRIHATRGPVGIDSSLEDVTDRVRSIEQLSYLAEHDSLTGALDRRHFEQLLTEQLRAVGSGMVASLASFNLRQFRLVNSLYGLYAGDTVLSIAAKRLIQAAPPESVVARLGGDVFVVLYAGRSAKDIHDSVFQLLEALVNSPFKVGDRLISLRASAGLMDLNGDMKVADAITGVEYASRQGSETRPLVLLASDTPALAEWVAQQALIRRIKSEHGLTGLYLMAQPIVSLKKPHQGRNFEVLIRMKDESGQEVPIARLLSAIEAAGMMPQIDLWVVEHTLSWLSQHAGALENIDFVCVNLGGTSLNDAQFLTEVSNVLQRYASVSGLLCLEVTEAVALLDFSHTRHVMESLRALGVRFALDDFGAGYTSFSYLTELPAEVLKIDGSLIVDLPKHPARQAVISGIARMSADLGMRCIAEWVDNVETLDLLVEAGIDYAQGFSISRPLNIDRMSEVRHCITLVESGGMRDRLQALGEYSLPGVH